MFERHRMLPHGELFIPLSPSSLGYLIKSICSGKTIGVMKSRIWFRMERYHTKKNWSNILKSQWKAANVSTRHPFCQ